MEGAAHHTQSGAATESILELAKQYDGVDRWSLEALGIAARGRENALYAKLREFRTAVRAALHSDRLQSKALELADDLGDAAYAPDLAALATSASLPEPLRITAVQALGRTRDQAFVPALEKLSRSGPLPVRVAAVRAIGDAWPPTLETRFKRLILSQEPNELRTEAVRVLARSVPGQNLLLNLQQSSELPAELKNVTTNLLNNSRNAEVRRRAATLLPPLVSKNKTKLPPIEELVWRHGDADRGHKIFLAESGPKCAGCHSIGGSKKVGPDLSNIGTKLGKAGLFDSILNPSAGIAPQYYMWVLETKTQGQVIGIISEDTPQRVVVKTDATTDVRLKPSEITSRRHSRLSMMPEGLMNSMTEQQLVDVVEFLTTLKTERASK